MIKRILAWVGLGLIALMYVITAISAVMARPEAHAFLMASIVMTIFVPIVLWIFIKLYEMAHKDDGISMREMRKINKRLKNGEDAEKIAKEIEEKYKKEK